MSYKYSNAEDMMQNFTSTCKIKSKEDILSNRETQFRICNLMVPLIRNYNTNKN